MLTLSFSGATDGFTVGNLWLTSVTFDVKFTLETIDNDVQVKLAHTGDNGLARFFISVNAEGWIFFGEFSETDCHLFLVSLRLWFYCDRYWWIWELDRFEMDWMCWIAKRGTSSSIFETYDCSDIASTNLVDIITLISEHTYKTANTFLIAGRSVKYIRT